MPHGTIKKLTDRGFGFIDMGHGDYSFSGPPYKTQPTKNSTKVSRWNTKKAKAPKGGVPKMLGSRNDVRAVGQKAFTEAKAEAPASFGRCDCSLFELDAATARSCLTDEASRLAANGCRQARRVIPRDVHGATSLASASQARLFKDQMVGSGHFLPGMLRRNPGIQRVENISS